MFKIVKDLATIGTKVYCELYVTSKAELTSEAVPIGMPAGRELASGSYGVTWYGDCFIYDETEGWSVIGGKEDAADANSAPKTLSLSKGPEEEQEPIEELEPIEETKAVKE